MLHFFYEMRRKSIAPKKRTQIANLVMSAKDVLEKETVSDELRVVVSSLIDAIQLLSNRLGLNSSNSSKPPSTDFLTSKKTKTARGEKRKPGGQKGHRGSRLEPVERPTSIEVIEIDRRTLPPGRWSADGFEKRQVFDIEVSFGVTEYQAEVLVNQNGDRYVAEFPKGITEPAQYGSGIRSTSVYLSQFQLIPQARVQDCFSTQYGLSLTKGSVNNFNQYAASKLRKWRFDDWMKNYAVSSDLLHADETGININKVGYWIHCLSNESFSFFHIDPKRGTAAMERMGVLPNYKGQLVHDHWKPYFTYICTHVLCNAHHLRELQRAYEQDNQKWALKIKELLYVILKEVELSGGKLSKKRVKFYQKKYRKILFAGTKECPHNAAQRAQSKSYNLLQRLLAYEEETLRFMVDREVPFTNNQGERDLRMNKVQQKISGCFRALRGAEDFCLIRSYLSTCRKNEIQPMEALRRLFEDEPPEFLKIKK